MIFDNENNEFLGDSSEPSESDEFFDAVVDVFGFYEFAQHNALVKEVDKTLKYYRGLFVARLDSWKDDVAIEYIVDQGLLALKEFLMKRGVKNKKDVDDAAYHFHFLAVKDEIWLSKTLWIEDRDYYNGEPIVDDAMIKFENDELIELMKLCALKLPTEESDLIEMYLNGDNFFQIAFKLDLTVESARDLFNSAVTYLRMYIIIKDAA